MTRFPRAHSVLRWPVVAGARPARRLPAGTLLARRLFVPLLPAGLLLAACSPGEPDLNGSTDLSVEALRSPAGPHSEEPSVSSHADGPVLTWLQTDLEDGKALRAARLGEDGTWEPLPDLVRSDSLLVNWADFPAVAPLDDGRLAAHWLALGPQGGLDYGVRVAVSEDGGRSWGPAWTPHEDGLPVEHGFVSFVPAGGGGYVVWLDGRAYHTSEDGPMTLRARAFSPAGPTGEEEVLDARICDCCQTDAAVTDSGAVVVYRDRTEEEVRDIRVVRLGPEGWEEPRPVHDDGWVIGGCPVNGPAVAARDGRVAVVWFTAPEGTALVRVAFSSDGGRTFGDPIRVDEGDPAGRVDVALLEGGRAVVSWIERAPDSAGLLLRTVSQDGTLGPPVRAATPGAERSSGFPRMAPMPGGDLLLAWTVPGDPSTVEVARIRSGTEE